VQDRGVDTGQTEHQHRDQGGDRKSRLDRDTTDLTAQTLVLSARVMMLESAVTIESPVTTV
jgi:hypothetical protein